MGTVLLGCILPRVSTQWHLLDKNAGLLLFVQFATSASGALLVRRYPRKTLARGYGLAGLGGMGIFLAQQRSVWLFALALAAFGLGLGMAMTSTSMLVSRRYPDRRGAALAILNFFWSVGAVACPLLVARFFPGTSSGPIFGLLGLLVFPFIALPLVVSSHAEESSANPMQFGGISEARLITNFALLAFLYVGIESAVGNWISTFAIREVSWATMGSSRAAATFWAALLLGRAITPAMLTMLEERHLVGLSLAFVIGGVGLLLAAHSSVTILAGAAVTGLALAPLFPLILSLFLSQASESRNAGWVFAVAGFGGAVLSWLAGVVSTIAGSLRIALLVPGAAALLMLVIALRPITGGETRNNA